MSALRVFSLAAGIVLACAYAGAVNAEEAGGARSMVEEVLVTARKRKESLQEVPVAVSNVTTSAGRPSASSPRSVMPTTSAGRLVSRRTASGNERAPRSRTR